MKPGIQTLAMINKNIISQKTGFCPIKICSGLKPRFTQTAAFPFQSQSDPSGDHVRKKERTSVVFPGCLRPVSITTGT